MNDSENLNPGLPATEYPTVDPDNADISAFAAQCSGDEAAVMSTNEWAHRHFEPIINKTNGLAAAMNVTDPDQRQKILDEAQLAVEDVLPVEEVNVTVAITAEDYDYITSHTEQEIEQYSADLYQSYLVIKNSSSDFDSVMRNALTTQIDDVEVRMLSFKNSAYVKAGDIIAAQDLEMITDVIATVPIAMTNAFPSGVTSAVGDLDSIVDGISAISQTAQASLTSFDSLKEDFVASMSDDASKASSFMDNITLKMLNASQVAMDLLSRTKTICNDDSLSVKDRIKGLLTATGLVKPDNENISPMEPYQSGFSGMTGMSPLAAYGENIVKCFDNIDTTSIATRITSTCAAIGKGIGAAFSGLGNGIGKFFHKIKSSTVAPDDLYIYSKRSDPVVYNMGWTFKLDQASSAPYLQYLSTDEYTVFTIFGTKIYLWIDSDNLVRGILKFPAAKNATINNMITQLASDKNHHPSLFNWWTRGVSVMENANLGDSNWEDPKDDKEVIVNLMNNKRNFIYGGTAMLCWCFSPFLTGARLGVTSDLPSVLNSWKADMNSTDLMDIFEDITTTYSQWALDPTQIPSNPTNQQIATEACYFLGSQHGNSPFNVDFSTAPSTPGAAMYDGDSFIIALIDMCCRYTSGNWVYGPRQGLPRSFDYSSLINVSYLPYYHSNSSMDGRYAIKTDDDNAKAYAVFIAAFVITVAVVLVGAKIIKTKLGAKKNIFNLEHSINTDSYHMEEAMQGSPDDMKRFFGMAGIDYDDIKVDDFGVPNDPKQISKMQKFWRKDLRKRQKKLNRLQKLTSVKPSNADITALTSRVTGDNYSSELNLDSVLYTITGRE